MIYNILKWVVKLMKYGLIGIQERSQGFYVISKLMVIAG